MSEPDVRGEFPNEVSRRMVLRAAAWSAPVVGLATVAPAAAAASIGIHVPPVEVPVPHLTVPPSGVIPGGVPPGGVPTIVVPPPNVPPKPIKIPGKDINVPLPNLPGQGAQGATSERAASPEPSATPEPAATPEPVESAATPAVP